MTKHGVAPAVVVKDERVDGLLGLLEAEEDHIPVRNEFYEGRELTKAELERSTVVFLAVQIEANKSLAPHVKLEGLAVESRGFGVRYRGTDLERRDYDVEYGLPYDVRLGQRRLESEDVVRGIISDVVDAVLSRRAEYLRRAGLSS